MTATGGDPRGARKRSCDVTLRAVLTALCGYLPTALPGRMRGGGRRPPSRPSGPGPSSRLRPRRRCDLCCRPDAVHCGIWK
jgi:hypothetical protein